MKNVIKYIFKWLKIFWDFNLSIILFVLYIVFFMPYKFVNLFIKERKDVWWINTEKYNDKNKFLPF